MSSKAPGSVFKRLETDTEFIARVRAKYAWWKQFSMTLPTGADLDEQTWCTFKMQRRVIEAEC